MFCELKYMLEEFCDCECLSCQSFELFLYNPNLAAIIRVVVSTALQRANKHDQLLRMIYGFFNTYPLSPNSTITQLIEPGHGTETKKARIFRIVSLKDVISTLMKSTYTLTSKKLE